MSVFDEFDRVSWRDLQGNRYTKSLDPAMLTKAGSPHIVKATTKGSEKGIGQAKVVIYDRDYVTQWLIVKLIKPLSNHGLDGVTMLLKKAWNESNLSTESLVIYANNLDDEEEQ